MFEAETSIYTYMSWYILVLSMHSGSSLVCYYPRICIGSLPVVITHADHTAGSHTLTLAFTLSNGATGSTSIPFVVEGESPELAYV